MATDAAVLSLQELMEATWEADRALRRAYEERFTVGEWVRVRHGDHETDVRVVRVAGDNVIVRNPNTGKEYAVSPFRLVEFEER